MNIEHKIKDVCNKLSLLKANDKRFSIFGSSSHRYLLNEKLSETEVRGFEEKYAITLPEEYRAFVLQVGNGGAGPYYGIRTLEDSLFAGFNRNLSGEVLNLSLDFPFTEPWNMKFSEYDGNEAQGAYQQFEKEYFAEKWETGILRLCNYGCGASLNLVVKGKEKGHMWVDDRGSDGGIYPDVFFDQTDRTTFLDWYLMWLDMSLKEVGSG